MGAYENPTQAIDRESGMIIANAISRIGQQTANYLQTYADERNKELKEAKKEEDARLATQEANRDVIHANIQTAGGRSQSWFDLADNAINLKFKYEGLLDDAPDEDIENEDGTITYSKKTLNSLISKEKLKIRTLTQSLLDIKEWSGTQGKKLLNSKTNEAGGIYTGSCKEGSSKFNKSICQDYERKMALMGTLTRDGKVVSDVKYDIREICPDPDDSNSCIPSVWATIEGKDSFNVSDVLAQDYAEAENIFKGEDNDGINFITQETGIFNAKGYLIDSMYEAPFMGKMTDQNTGEEIGVKAIRPVDINKVLGILTPAYETHFMSMVNSIENRQDYNDLMATYLVYSKDGEDLETVADGVWKLTDEAKAKFVQTMVGYSLEKKIPGYETISAQENEDGTITFLNQENQEETVEANTKYSYKGEIGELTGAFADKVVEDLKGPKKDTSQRSQYDIQAENSVNLLMDNPENFIKKEALDQDENVKMEVINDTKKGKSIKVTTLSEYKNEETGEPIEIVKEYFTNNKYDTAGFLKKYLWGGTTKQDNQLRQFADRHISNILQEQEVLAQKKKEKDKALESKFKEHKTNWKKWKLDNAHRYRSPEKLQEWKEKNPNKDTSGFVEIPPKFLPFVIAEEKGIEMTLENLNEINKELFKDKKEN